jgi:hypothetical protein
MANTLEQIIADLEGGLTPVAEPKVVEKTAAAPTVENQDNELVELRKLAASLDEQGRVFAHSFMDEIQKLAVGVSELTPNTAAVPENPAVQVSNAEVHEADTAKVESIIKKLTLGGEAKVNPAGVIHENDTPVAATQPIAPDEHPVAADVKKADAEIITALYDRYFA